jgi:hypothetical protein
MNDTLAIPRHRHHRRRKRTHHRKEKIVAVALVLGFFLALLVGALCVLNHFLS